MVGFGGGLIKPAQDRWGGWLANLQGQLDPGRRRWSAAGRWPAAGPDHSQPQAQTNQTQAQTTQAQTTQTRTQPVQPGNGHPAANDTPTPPVGFNRVDR